MDSVEKAELAETDEAPQHSDKHNQIESGVGEQEHQKPFVVVLAQTRVQEGTVVVVLLNTLAANRAVERLFCLYDLAKDAQLVHMDAQVKELVNQGQKLKFWLDHARVNYSRHNKTNRGGQQAANR